MPRKGYGLKIWKRIKRDRDKVGRGSIQTGEMLTQDLLDSGVNSSNQMQKAESSVSSTNAVVRSMDGFPLLGDSGLGVSPSLSAGTDSDNSGDWSSKSSTAASSPKIKLETPVIAGSLCDKNWMRGFGGKSLVRSVPRGQQGKDRNQTTKKPRGQQVKIEKGSSHSSVNSDSQSSNFVFMQGTYVPNNVIQNERANDFEENCDRGQGSRKQVSNGHQVGYDRGRGENKELSPEGATDSSWEVREERNEIHGSSRDQDPLVESLSVLQSAQEALEKELLMFKDVSQDISVDNSVLDLHTEYIDADQKIPKVSSSEWLTNCETVQSLTQARGYEAVENMNRDVEAELEDLFMQKIEAEVEYLTISRVVQKLRVASVDQITIVEEQRALLSEHAQMLDKLGDAENKALMLKKEAEKLETVCEDINVADETLKLQRRVYKHGSCFILQLVLLAVVLTLFMRKISHNFVEPVPT